MQRGKRRVEKTFNKPGAPEPAACVRQRRRGPAEKETPAA